MEKYDYTYGMKRGQYTLYALEDPKYPGVIRYIGYTSATPEHRLGRHMGEVWGQDSQDAKILKQKWIRGLASQGRTPKIVPIYQSTDSSKVKRLESVLIKYLWDGITNAVSNIGEDTYQKRKNSDEGKEILKEVHKKYKSLDVGYKGIELNTTYPEILKGTKHE